MEQYFYYIFSHYSMLLALVQSRDVDVSKNKFMFLLRIHFKYYKFVLFRDSQIKIAFRDEVFHYGKKIEQGYGWGKISRYATRWTGFLFVINFLFIFLIQLHNS